MKEFLSKYIISIPLLFSSLQLMAQEDLIIYRNGNEKNVKLVMVSSDLVTYRENSKNTTEFQDSLKNVYMLKFSKRGNVYITEDGKRMTGENQKISKEANLIYLISGREIQAYSLRIEDDKVLYDSKKESGGIFNRKRTSNSAETIPLSDVFFIKYSDGTKDLIKDISAEAIRKEKEEAERLAREQAELEEAKKNEKKVVFHQVKRGETLGSIAKKYKVSSAEILEWNDLPRTYKLATRLKADMQLMIYVKPNTAQ